MPEHILSLSYGKDSLASLGAIEQLGWPLDRIVHAEVMATDTIPADLPVMIEFKMKADEIIKKRYGIKVEHVHGKTAESIIYHRRTKGKRVGQIVGWPLTSFNGGGCELQRPCKVLLMPPDAIQYVGIAADEQRRFNILSDTKKSPLVEIGWTENDCYQWCKDNNLLSPLYSVAKRGGCFFCPNQGVDTLRSLRKQHPELWELMLKWDADSPVHFKPDGHTVHDFDKRFQMEDEGLLPTDKRFLWKMIQ